MSMYKNYFKVTIRNIKRDKFYSGVNILGLGVGICTCLLMWMYIGNELGYDAFHSKSNRIIRIGHRLNTDPPDGGSAVTPFPLRQVLINEITGIEEAVRFFHMDRLFAKPTLKYQDQVFIEDKFFFTDPSVFKVFDFKLEKGDLNTALEDQNSVVISKEIARKYFGDSNPLGKVIRFNDWEDMIVTGVLAELPKQSHLQFEFLAPMKLFRKWWMDLGGPDINTLWSSNFTWTYALLNPGVEESEFSGNLKTIVNEYFAAEDRDLYTFKTHKLLDIHLLSKFRLESSSSANYQQLRNLGLIALLVLIIATLNFVNLTTAQAVKRAKEIGVRKVIGARRTNLIIQFLFEASISVSAALIFAIFLSWLILPSFNLLIEKSLSLQIFLDSFTLVKLVLGGMALGLISGIYPAIYLASFNPTMIFRGRSNIAKGKFSIRKILVTVQFIFSIALIFSIVTIYRQLEFLKNKDLGYDKEQVLLLMPRGGINEKFDVLKTELLQNPQVIAVSKGDPIQGGWSAAGLFVEGKSKPQTMALRYIDEDFDKVFDIKLKYGKRFNRALKVSPQVADSNAVYLLNETAVKHLGWHDDPIGKKIWYQGSNLYFEGRVIGVVEDFNFSALYDPVKPLVLRYLPFGKVTVKIRSENISQTISMIEDKWKSLAPEAPFEFYFLDDQVDNQYKSDQKLGKTINYFTIIAITLSSLGLLGLVSYSVEQRKKEFGIRKVLGAPIMRLVMLIEGDFIKMSIIAFLIAAPISYFLSLQWLQNFAYRISINWWVFALVMAIQMFLVLLTVSYQSVKAAIHKPVDNLQSE